MKIALLTSDIRDLDAWKASLGKADVAYDIIDITGYNWIDKCQAYDYPLFLARSPGTTNLIKQVFDERIQILVDELGKKVYPSLAEIRLHENKKYLAIWLQARGLPHPRTAVLTSKNEAEVYLSSVTYPVVYKQNIGSSGKGVRILRSSSETHRLLKKAFRKGVRLKIGPNLRTASVFRKLKNAFQKKGLLSKRVSYYRAVYNEPQKYLILQDYVQHDYEWRAVVIGDSYFAHKKMVSGGMASGSLAKNYDNPPLALLDLIRNISTNHGISSASIDLFETPNGFLINEIQTYFGQSDPYQMKVDGVPGRYRYLDGKWVFEPGDWAKNQCYDLRLEHALSLVEG